MTDYRNQTERAKPTPYPWLLAADGAVIGSNGVVVAETEPGSTGLRPSIMEQAANQRLIITAPRLLADCEAVLSHLEQVIREVASALRLPQDQAVLLEDPILARLRETLAVVRGEQSP